MRRIITILLTLCAVVCYASDIECVGTATQVVTGTDTVYIFKDEVHLRSKVGAINWYYADGSLYASGVDEIYPDDGCYKAAGSSFCVALYADMPDLDFTVDTRCDNTVLHVTGFPSSAYARTYSLSYDTLAWNTEQWVDSLAEEEGILKSTIHLPALYGATTITLCYDTEIRSALGLDTACIDVDVPIESIIAVKHELTSLTTTRDAKNEKNRPSSQDIIKATVGEDISGPLDVAFYSNATPAARFFQWDIYHSTEHIVRRFDPDIRYQFSEPGAYRVVCKVSNNTCSSDSTEMMVAIS